jgi:CHASE2 domain-containing sensor protein
MKEKIDKYVFSVGALVFLGVAGAALGLVVLFQWVPLLAIVITVAAVVYAFLWFISRRESSDEDN